MAGDVRPQVVALIQARGGSKGVPGKNVRNLGGHPVLAWSVAACRLAKSIERTVLSTDSTEIADAGRRYGADVPFMRPAAYASDTATDLMVITHAIEWFRDHEGHVPEYVVQIRPTTPLRDPRVIDAAVAALKAAPDATGLRSVYEMPESAWKTFEIDSHGYLVSLMSKVQTVGIEASNLPRQAFASTYCGQGYVDILRSEIVLEKGLTYGERILGFLSADVGEIDSEDDFKKLEYHLSTLGSPLLEFLNADVHAR